MKFQKMAKVLLSCLMAGALFTGCGGGDQQGGSDKKDAAQSSEVKLGMISHLNATEKKMEDILTMVNEETKIPVSKFKVTYYDNLNLMQMGIESGSIDEISVYKSVGGYIVANNNKYENAYDALNLYNDNFCFAVRKEDTALKADLDKVIGEMKADGTLDKILKEYVTDVDKGKTPSVIEIPKTDGADTVKVGVTGDLPPLDYVSADGQAAGFNTALLAEIAKRSGKNVEIVDIDSGARATALNSKQIDVIFWVTIPASDKIPADIDKPEGVELSIPYFNDSVEHLKLNK